MALRRHLVFVLLATVLLALPGAAHTAVLPSGFQETVVFSGLTNPTVVRFSPDGRVFVAEKSGLIKVFDNLTDPTPTVFADLSTNVLQLLGPRSPRPRARPRASRRTRTSTCSTRYDAAIGGVAPRWGTPGVLGPLPDAAGRDRRRVRDHAAGSRGSRLPATR